MHRRLLEWAAWSMVGDGSGYPTMSVLHEDWSPPSPGVTPTMKVSAPNSARRTQRVIAGWSARLRNTVVLHYCCPGLTVAEQADRLQCVPATLYQRVEQAHMLLRLGLEAAPRQFHHMDETG